MINRYALQPLLNELFGDDVGGVIIKTTTHNEVSFVDQETGFDRVLIDHKTDNGIEYGYSLKWKALIIKINANY